MQTNIQQWGNSLGIRIPSPIVKKLSLNSGMKMNIKTENGQIYLTPEKYSLSQLLEKVNDNNLHHDIWNNEEIAGKEEW